MKKIVPYSILLIGLIILELSWSSFFSFQERSYFFLFSVLAVWIVKQGFFRAFPLVVLTAILFEGITQSAVGPISFYGVLFAYGIGFLLKRLHLEYGVERVFLSLAVGIGIALYPVFLSGYASGGNFLLEGIFSPRSFLENTIFGGILFLAMLHFHDRFYGESPSLGSSFSK